MDFGSAANASDRSCAAGKDTRNLRTGRPRRLACPASQALRSRALRSLQIFLLPPCSRCLRRSKAGSPAKLPPPGRPQTALTIFSSSAIIQAEPKSQKPDPDGGRSNQKPDRDQNRSLTVREG